MSYDFDALSTEARPLDFWSNTVTDAAPLSLEALRRAIDYYGTDLDHPLRIEPHVEIVSPDEYTHRKEHGCRGGWCYYESKQKSPRKGNR